MRLSNRTLIPLILWTLSASSVIAGDQQGTRAYPFLRIGTDARAMGIGSAYTAIAVGPGGMDWNVAGIAGLNRPAVTTSFLDYGLSGVGAGSIAFVQPMGTRGSVGVGVRYFRVGDIPTTTEANPTGEGLGNFSSTDIAARLAFAYRLTPGLHAGISGSVISGSIDDRGSFGLSSDYGLLWNRAPAGLRLGAALRNVGTQTSAYFEIVDPMPTELSFGASRPFPGSGLLIGIDYNWSVDWEGTVDLGVEWTPVTDFFLRAGYNGRGAELRDSSEEAGIAGYTFGLGFRKVRAFAIDYAYASLADLGGTNRVSFTWEFQ